jgi:hypothetical protein
MVNAPGVDMLDLKRHGSWRSSSVAEGYIAVSLTKRLIKFYKFRPYDAENENNPKKLVLLASLLHNPKKE